MRRRLLVSYLSLAVLVLALLEIPLAAQYARSEQQTQRSRIERDAVGIATIAAGDLTRGSSGRATFRQLAVAYGRQTGGRVTLLDPHGRVLVGVRPPGGRALVAPALAGALDSGARASSRGDVLVAAAPIAAVGGPLRGAVAITYPLASVERRVHAYWLTLGGVAVVVLLVAGLVGHLFARSVSRPLDAVERAAARAGGGDLDARAPTAAGPPEVRSLAREFNRTVERLDELVRSQEAFVADASHQLRTPLAALRLRLENLESDVAPGARHGVEASLGEVERLSRLVDGLLALARAEHPGGEADTIDLAAVAAGRCDVWRALAEERGVTLAAPGPLPAVPVRAGRERLVQVIDNLIENALDAAPLGSDIEVAVRSAPAAVELHVVDGGAGLTPEQRRRAFDRFWRGRDGDGGSGLGLAIARRLARADGGEVELREADGGGVEAVVSLRPAAALR